MGYVSTLLVSLHLSKETLLQIVGTINAPCTRWRSVPDIRRFISGGGVAAGSLGRLISVFLL